MSLYKLILKSLRRPVSVIMLYIGVMVIGIISGLSIPEEYVPDIAVPELVVSTVYPSGSPEDVRLLVTMPLEDALSSLNGLKSIKSVSRSGVSTIRLEFQWGTDVLVSGVKAREVIDRTFQSLPEECKKPLVFKIDPNRKPLLIIGIYPVRGNILDTRRRAERELKTEIQQVKGVGNVVVTGGNKREIHIDAGSSLLSSRGINITDLASALASENINFPAGSFIRGRKEYVLKVNGEAGSLEELKALKLLIKKTGKIITLRDIGSVYMGEKEQKSYFQWQGNEGVGLIVRRSPGQNPVEVSRRVTEKVKTLNENYSRDLKLKVLYDASVSIEKSVNGLFLNLILGGLIAFFVILVFIRDLRSALILVLSMPFSIFLTLMLMKLTNLSFNIMSLGGLALGIGMLVDNSVVVLENIDKRIVKLKKAPTVRDIASYTDEMASSTFGSTITSVIVFLPVLFLPGIIGALYRELALTVSYSLLSSFVVSVTLIPVLYSLTFKDRGRGATASQGTLEALYGKPLLFILNRRYLLIVIILILAAGSLYLFKKINIRFMPRTGSDELVVDVIPEPGTDMERIKEISKSLTEKLLKYPEIESLYCRAGAESDDTYFLSDPEDSAEVLHFFLKLKNLKTTKARENLVNRLEKELSVQGAYIDVHRPEDIILKLLKITSTGERFVVRSERLEDSSYYREKLGGKIESSGFFGNFSIKPSGEIKEIYLEPNRAEIARSKTQVEQLAGIVRGSVYGLYPAKLTLEGEKYDIRIRVPENERNSTESIGRIVYTGENGYSVPLSRLVRISRVSKEASLLRIDRRDAFFINLKAKEGSGKKEADFLESMRKRYPEMESVRASVFHDYLTSIILTFAVALLLLYLFLGAQFESLSQPLILLAALPLGLIGVIPMLILGGSSLNLNSGLGILVLFGISVNNSIVLKNTIRRNALRKGNADINVVIKSSVERLRPILITTITTIGALIPTAFNVFGESSQSSLALAVIGGLLVSSMLTLFVIPTISVKPANSTKVGEA